ncbi:hypothetical protein IWX65_001225 [Arthrobacter sp. CAN_A214]
MLRRLLRQGPRQAGGTTAAGGGIGRNPKGQRVFSAAAS